MDMIAGVASVSQLAAYSFSSIRYLQQLHSELKNFGSAYRNEEAKISLLLAIIKDLSSHGVCDTDPIVPILLDISKIACEVLHLLQPRVLWGINWTPLTKQDELKSALGALAKNQNLLHIHISGKTLAALRAGIQRPRMANPSFETVRPMASASAKFTCNSNKIQGVQEVLCGYDTLPNEVEVNDNNVPLKAVHRAGNKNEMSGEQLVEIVRSQSAETKQSTSESTQQENEHACTVGGPPGKKGYLEDSEFMRRKRLNYFRI